MNIAFTALASEVVVLRKEENIDTNGNITTTTHFIYNNFFVCFTALLLIGKFIGNTQ